MIYLEIFISFKTGLRTIFKSQIFLQSDIFTIRYSSIFQLSLSVSGQLIEHYIFFKINACFELSGFELIMEGEKPVKRRKD